MSFAIPRYREPDFAALGLERAPDVKLVPAERDGVMPRGYHATTLFPEYYHIGGRWVLAEDSRMDCVAVVRDGAVSIVEFRNVRAGELVVVGRTEDGSEGIYVHPNCFVDQSGEAEAFAFRTWRSRETAYSIDYDGLYDLLRHEREHGNILWVMGPACSFDADSRAAFAALVRDGFVNGLMAGNALATHDLEAGYLGTALGQDVYTQQAHFNGHYNHTSIPSMRSAAWAPSRHSWSPARSATASCMSASAIRCPLCWWALSGMTAPCRRCTAMSTRARTPCGSWCGRPPPSSVWHPPSTQWPPEI